MGDYGAAGAALELRLRDTKYFKPHEEVLLEQACRTADELARLEEALGGASSVVTGSTGQERPNPLFAEVRATRTLLARLVSDATSGVKPSQEKARAAARVRWGQPDLSDNYRDL